MRQNKAPESVRLPTRKSAKNDIMLYKRGSEPEGWTFPITLAIEGGHLAGERWKLRCEADLFYFYFANREMASGAGVSARTSTMSSTCMQRTLV